MEELTHTKYHSTTENEGNSSQILKDSLSFQSCSWTCYCCKLQSHYRDRHDSCFFLIKATVLNPGKQN